MNDSERFKLLHGAYVPPRCRAGDVLPCEYRGREFKVGGMTDAPIQRPYAQQRGGPRSPIVCGDLIRAIRSESAIAVARHWGVDTKTVTTWRRAMGVPRFNEGTNRLIREYTPERLTEEAHALGRAAMKSPEVRAGISAARKRHGIHANTRRAQRVAVSRPKAEAWKKAMSQAMRRHWQHPEEHGRPPRHAWTEEEIARLRTASDP